MKKAGFPCAIIVLTLLTANVFSQGKYSESITASELESHVSFLASPLLKGRMNGDETLDIASNYIAVQARLAGLKPANNGSYFQPFAIIRKKADPSKTYFEIISDNDTTRLSESFFHVIPQGPAELNIEGDIVFAGYGIKSDKYNDLENLDLKGKIVLVMNRGPLSKDLRPVLNDDYYGQMNFQFKIGPLLSPGPKAILLVPDPASGFPDFNEAIPGLSGYLSTSTRLSGDKEKPNPVMSMLPKIIFINRKTADALLSGTGTNLAELQDEINTTLKPHSFAVNNCRVVIKEQTVDEERILNNIAGYVEGSHPEKKNEFIIYSSHYDHIGAQGNEINPGADDNASGCSALLEIAETFSDLKKKPLRSILFLWVPGEEIGLFGSETYVNNPLIPLEKTVADLNVDMIGRTKEPADSTSETPMTGPDEVFVITGGQSSELTAIANEADKRSPLSFDYSLSGRQHPLQLFSRSDHFNFVRKDIPVLFFSTGLHSDYHSPRDVLAKINFQKMEIVTRTMFDIGFTLANRKERIIVDNPYSSWEKKN
ncbi:MAG TPA: M28 family peptidase [Bacteroidales bacterium]|nr:M28 family peptidase [Bacteroidales bacterium]